MEHKLSFIDIDTSSSEELASTSLEIVSTYSSKLKDTESETQFKSLEDEIAYFKHYKPKLLSRYIYFYRLFEFEVRKKHQSPKQIRKFFRKEKKRMQSFHEKNIDFIDYYRSNQTNKDHEYFTRKNCFDSTCTEKTIVALSSPGDSKNDLIIAELLSNDMLYVYVEKELRNLKDEKPEGKARINKLKWTGSKVAMIELIYALASSNAINNGNIDIKDIISEFELFFGLKIDSPYQSFSEIKNRKTDVTKFLDKLKDALSRRIDEDYIHDS
ncbi:RteC domain-containing protein [Fluviicola taffensis]|nr:RteC domain-containing protein [Fluviicola taffensis]